MLVVGLTGSIAMGKSETARMFRRLGVPVFDSDAAVHRLYAPGGAAVAPISGCFPEVVQDGAVDRARLAAIVTADPRALADLEALVHPLVRAEQAEFLAESRRRGVRLVVLDIPLLYETGGPLELDAVVVVTAPEAVQRERALDRPGMTEEKLAAILARQVADSEKRRRADFVVETQHGLERAFEDVRLVVDRLLGFKPSSKD